MPLPKLTPTQMMMLQRRFESLGFTAAGTRQLRASKARTRISVEQAGVCTSNEDVSDVLAPVLPEILASPREEVPFGVVRDSYFTSQRIGGKLLFRLTPRLESELFWDELRQKGSCALMPDERAVYSAILSSCASLSSLVTDFPVEGSAVRLIGKRQYYDSKLGPAEAGSTLRGIGTKGARNTYLPRNSMLVLDSGLQLKKELAALFRELGDWCFLSLRKPRQKL